MRKRYLVAVLLVLLAATALSMSLVTTNADANPVFVPVCAGCHSGAYPTGVHAVAAHAGFINTCATCHTVNTATPPLPATCAAGNCHGGATAILASTTHAANACGTTPGCHGFVSPTPTPTPTTTPTTTPTPTPTPTPLVTPKASLALSGLNNGVVKMGKSVTAKGTVKPASLAGSQVKITVQKKSSGKWMTIKSVMRTIRANGAYSWNYKPAKSGTYRMRTTIARTSTHASAATPWRGFKAVKRVVIPDYNG
jgi:hypothetical protein